MKEKNDKDTDDEIYIEEGGEKGGWIKIIPKVYLEKLEKLKYNRKKAIEDLENMRF